MDYVEKIKSKYSYLSDCDIKYYVAMAKSLLIDRLYPADITISCETYIIPPRFDWWIVECACEYIARDGMTSLVSYKENGVSYTWDKSGISQGLLDRLPRRVGVI